MTGCLSESGCRADPGFACFDAEMCSDEGSGVEAALLDPLLPCSAKEQKTNSVAVGQNFRTHIMQMQSTNTVTTLAGCCTHRSGAVHAGFVRLPLALSVLFLPNLGFQIGRGTPAPAVLAIGATGVAVRTFAAAVVAVAVIIAKRCVGRRFRLSPVPFGRGLRLVPICLWRNAWLHLPLCITILLVACGGQ